MKKVIKPAEREEAVFYSDFTGKPLGETDAPCSLTLDFGYGSKYDNAKVTLHLDDEDVEKILTFISSKLCNDVKTKYKKYIEDLNDSYEDAIEWRSYNEADLFYNSTELYKKLIGDEPV